MKKELSLSQIKAIQDIEQSILTGNIKTGFSMMTGGGKTFIAAKLAEKYKECKKILFVVRGKKITKQNYEAFKEVFPKAGLILRNKKQVRNVSIASIDTILANEGLKKYIQNFFDFVIVDEAHLSTATNYIAFLKGMKKGCWFLGLSATYGINNKKAHDFWDDFVLGPEGWDLVKEGRIPAFNDIYLPKTFYNLDNVSTSSNGDYNSNELFDSVNKDSRLQGNIINSYKMYGKDKPAIAFCINIKHLEQIKKLFINHDYNVVSFHSKMSASEENENNKKMKYFIKNNLNFVIVSVDMLTAGVDIPELEVALMLRPTKSQNKFRQQVGRLTRNNPKKRKEIILIDFTKNTSNYGHIYNMLIPVQKTNVSKQHVKPIHRCSHCFYATNRPFTHCPKCGKIRKTEMTNFNPDHDQSVDMVKVEVEQLIAKKEDIRKSLDFMASLY